METSSIPDYPRGVTFEQVWASLQEVSEQQKKTDEQMKRAEEQLLKESIEHRKEMERISKEAEERKKEADERQKESAEHRKEMERISKEADERQRKADERQRKLEKQMGFLSNRFGELAEHLVAPGINKRFNEIGYHFDEMAKGGIKIWEGDKIKAEIDLLLQNDTTVMAVEVKSKPDEDDIADHIKRIEILRDHRHKKNDMRQVEGAVAGAVFNAVAKKTAIKAGLYVIEQTGDTMKIEVPEGFVPRRW